MRRVRCSVQSMQSSGRPQSRERRAQGQSSRAQGTGQRTDGRRGHRPQGAGHRVQGRAGHARSLRPCARPFDPFPARAPSVQRRLAGAWRPGAWRVARGAWRGAFPARPADRRGIVHLLSSLLSRPLSALRLHACTPAPAPRSRRALGALSAPRSAAEPSSAGRMHVPVAGGAHACRVGSWQLAAEQSARERGASSGQWAGQCKYQYQSQGAKCKWESVALGRSPKAQPRGHELGRRQGAGGRRKEVPEPEAPRPRDPGTSRPRDPGASSRSQITDHRGTEPPSAPRRRGADQASPAAADSTWLGACVSG